MNKGLQGDKRLVPVENHYELFKEIEGKLREYLEGQGEELLLVGLRVAYDVLETSMEEPYVFPYTVEFGNLEDVDHDLECAKDVSEEDLNSIAKRLRIPIELLDETYADAKKKLEGWAGTALAVGVFLLIKTPMSIRSAGVGCYCRGRGRKARYAHGYRFCRVGC